MTEASLNLAKITAPVPVDIVERPRLYCALDAAVARPVVWIGAPAGCGKTTLVADYLQRRNLTFLWYQVGLGDADPASLFHFLRLAARNTEKAAGPLPPAFVPDYLPGIGIFARRFFRDLFGRMKPPFAVVLDNVQDAPEASPFHDILREGLTQIPPGGVVVLVSRTDLSPGLSRFRATRQVAEIGWDQLRFTEDESAALIQRLSDRPMAREAVASIVEATRGWAAGLILLTARPTRTGEGPQSPAMVPDEYLFDYFAREVFAQFDPARKNFLVRTALAPETTADLARALTGEAESEGVLHRLVRDGFFTDRRGSAPAVYQYHPLFRAFLLGQAAVSLPRDQIAELRNRAARLLEVADQVEAAADLYAEAGNWQALAAFVLRHAPRLVEQGRFPTVAVWVERLPTSVSERNAELLFWHGVCRLFPTSAVGRALLEKAYALAKASGNTALQWRTWSLIIESFFDEMKDLRPLDPWIAELKAFEAAGGTFPDREIEGRVLNAAVQALFHRAGLDPDLPTYADRALEIAKQCDGPTRTSHWAWMLGGYYSWTGQLAKSTFVLDALQPANKESCSPRLWLHWKINEMHHGWLWAVFDRFDKARVETLAQIEDLGVYTAALPVNAMACSAALSRSDTAEAAIHLERLKPTSPQRPADRQMEASFLRSWLYHIQAAYFDLLGDDAPSALRHAEQSLDCAAYCGSFWETLSELLRGLCLLELGDDETAERCFVLAIDLARRHRLQSTAFVGLVGAADLARRRGDREGSERALRDAFAVAHQHSIRNGPFWSPKQMADACAHALEAGIETDYVRSLVRQRGLRPTAPPRHLEIWPWPLAIRTFGEFEILRDGERVRFSRKAPRKPLDLLKTAIAFGGRGVGIDRLMDALWPDADGDAAHRAFYTTLHRLRRLLDIDDAVVVEDRRLSLSPHLCWVDLWCLTDLIGSATRMVRGNDPIRRLDDLVRVQERLLGLYRGPFLDGLADAPWAIPVRRKTASDLVRCLGDLGRYWERGSQAEHAARCRVAAAAVGDGLRQLVNDR